MPPQEGAPSLGASIKKGDLLGYVELPPIDRTNLLDSQVGAGIAMSRLYQDAALAQANVAAERARLELVEKEADRVRALVEAEALPKKRLDEIRSELKVRKASLEAAQQALVTYNKAISRYDSAEDVLDSIEESLPLYAPISGQLVESRAVAGQYVESREVLFRVVDLSRVWVEGQLFENDLPILENLIGGTFVLPGQEKISLEASSLVLIGSTVQAMTRTLPVIFEVKNRERRIKLGYLGHLDLRTNRVVEVLAVPKSAVLLEENRSVVYVQLEGETFERRLVKTGVEDQDWIQILDGLEEGDRIVTVGAYDVALEARSTEVPEHGHVH
jgi:RND family efflux transporter MFP subunit